jgi:hypothetical protein
MAGKPRETEKRTAEAEVVRPEEPAEGRIEGKRTATLNLPFVTAEFRAPELHAPIWGDVNAAARGAQSMLPSGKSLLFFGALAVAAAAEIIEWPVAVAIGVGSALAGQGAASPAPGGPKPGEVTTAGNGGKTGTTS